jgi:hypothetical protein
VNIRTKIAAVGIGALAVIGAGTAYAAVSQGAPKPPVACPEYGECNYSPGDYVYLCVNEARETVRVEVNTDDPDNCTSSEVQLAVQVPAGAYPSAAPSATSTGAPGQ